SVSRPSTAVRLTIPDGPCALAKRLRMSLFDIFFSLRGRWFCGGDGVSAHPVQEFDPTAEVPILAQFPPVQNGAREGGRPRPPPAKPAKEAGEAPARRLSAQRKRAALRVTIEGHRHDQDQAGRDRLPEGRDAEEIERVGDDAEQEDADDRAGHVAATAAERGAAD